MSSEVSTLGESFLAEWTFERTQTRMLSEVIPQIAALFENTGTVRIPTLKIELDSLSFRVLDPDSLVPLFRYAFESLMFRAT